eukprot:TRINITY_DN9013_c0_g4_i2.p1 TRINITY_DN9013_c0_g4~~TRINITY_DN9013_c0_g4_i2.p1  ORF type:complete len:596 (-),score=163.58 TRINITY_DN9013_c0_g4_i2:28-1815(-)
MMHGCLPGCLKRLPVCVEWSFLVSVCGCMCVAWLLVVLFPHSTCVCAGAADGSGVWHRSGRQQQQSTAIIIDGQVIATANWELDAAAFDFSQTEKLGAGQYGEVFKCKYLGSDVACKKLYMQNMDDKAHKEFLKEVQILSCLRHPNLILLLGICTQSPKLFLVTECMKRGSVEAFLYARRADKRQEETDEQKHLTYRRRMLIAKGTAQGMNWLHNLKPNAILHLDLKPANLLLDDNYNVKICDFGMSKVKDPMVQDEASSLVGTPYYMAPEILTQDRYDQQADVYSFGILLNELHSQQLPYTGRFKRFLELKDAVLKGQRPDYAVDTPARLKELIGRCTNGQPASRPSFKQMLAEQVFDRFILDYLISDANRNARVFWERKFFGRYTISWSEFVTAFCEYFQIRQVEETTVLLEMMKAIIAKEGASHYSSEPVVTLEQFGFMLEWFGPFEHGAELLTRVFSLCSRKWFHGNVTSVQAENMLVKQAERGCFLVRFSTSNPGSYTLSSLGADKQVRHRRINHRPGGPFDIGDITFPSLEALIKNPPRGLDIVVKKYCHGSQFQAILAGSQDILKRSMYVGSTLDKVPPKSPSALGKT